MITGNKEWETAKPKELERNATLAKYFREDILQLQYYNIKHSAKSEMTYSILCNFSKSPSATFFYLMILLLFSTSSNKAVCLVCPYTGNSSGTGWNTESVSYSITLSSWILFVQNIFNCCCPMACSQSANPIIFCWGLSGVAASRVLRN